MAEGIQVEVEDGFARIEFLDPAKRGPGVAALLAAGGPGLIDVDTRSGRRKQYIVPESIAEQAGFLDAAPVEPAAPAFPEGSPDDSWTVAQLTAYAEFHGVDLAGATRKADILAAVTAPADTTGDPAGGDAPAQ